MSFSCTLLERAIQDFYALKKIRRTGWQLRGIKNCESIADHCWGVVLLTHMLSGIVEAPINRSKAVSIAIAHELGETRVGDIPYPALKYFPDKVKMEQEAIFDITEPLGTELQSETLSLFNEFENGNTIEGRFVKAIDKLEMLVTASEYEKFGYSGLKDFWTNDSTFKTLDEFPELLDFANYLKNKRKNRLTGDE